MPKYVKVVEKQVFSTDTKVHLEVETALIEGIRELDYGLTSQIRRSSVSVASNIAEGVRPVGRNE
jgi:four helix bundle protein